MDKKIDPIEFMPTPLSEEDVKSIVDAMSAQGDVKAAEAARLEFMTNSAVRKAAYDKLMSYARAVSSSSEECERYSEEMTRAMKNSKSLKHLVGHFDYSTPATPDDFDGDVMSVVSTCLSSSNRTFVDNQFHEWLDSLGVIMSPEQPSELYLHLLSIHKGRTKAQYNLKRIGDEIHIYFDPKLKSFSYMSKVLGMWRKGIPSHMSLKVGWDVYVLRREGTTLFVQDPYDPIAPTEWDVIEETADYTLRADHYFGRYYWYTDLKQGTAYVTPFKDVRKYL